MGDLFHQALIMTAGKGLRNPRARFFCGKWREELLDDAGKAEIRVFKNNFAQLKVHNRSDGLNHLGSVISQLETGQWVGRRFFLQGIFRSARGPWRACTNIKHETFFLARERTICYKNHTA